MVEFNNVDTYSGAREYIETHEGDKKRLLYIYFTARKNESGDSWCPDCNEAEPLVMAAFEKHADPKSRVLVVDVGDRPMWKDPKNSYRQDADFRLQMIPTLLQWTGRQRLCNGQIVDEEDLEKFFKTDATKK